MSKLSNSISMRITDTEKERLELLANEQGESLKEYILNRTVYSNHKEVEKEVERLAEELAGVKDSMYKVEHLEELLKGKDDRIKDLSDQLQYANEQLTNNHTLISQQQQLNLATLDSNKTLKLELDSVKKDTNSNDTRGLWSRIWNL